MQVVGLRSFSSARAFRSGKLAFMAPGPACPGKFSKPKNENEPVTHALRLNPATYVALLAVQRNETID